MGQFATLRKVTPIAILERWPLPQDLLAVSPSTVFRHCDEASRGHFDMRRVKTLIHSAKTTIGLPEAADERRLEIQGLLVRWRLLRGQIAQLDGAIEAWVARCPEALVLTSVPEVSAVCVASIVSELGTPMDYEHPRQVLKLAGMNLVGKSSGQLSEQKTRKWQSKRGRPALRRQLFLLAGRWCQNRGLYHADYLALRTRNGNQGTNAVAAMARKLVPLLLKVLQSGESFDLARWQADRQLPGGGKHSAVAGG